MLKLCGIAFGRGPVRRRASVAAPQRHRHDYSRALLHAAALAEQPDAEGRIGDPVRANAPRDNRQPLRFAIRGADFMAAFDHQIRSEEHTSELQSLMRISYAVFCLKKKNKHQIITYLILSSTTTTQT